MLTDTIEFSTQTGMSNLSCCASGVVLMEEEANVINVHVTKLIAQNRHEINKDKIRLCTLKRITTYLYIYLWLYNRVFSFVSNIQPVGLLGRGISPSQGRCLHAEQHKQRINAHRHYMPRVGLEPTIPVFERTKTVHASDRAATVIGA
jgi:hypothetical protein